MQIEFESNSKIKVIMMRRLSRKEVAELGIYDFVGYIGAFESPYIGGFKGTEKLLSQMNIPRNPEFRVLEVGCAAGFASCKVAKEYGCDVTGIDISEILVAKAQERAEKMGLSNARFQVADVRNLPFEDNTFDAVYGIAIVALLPNKKQVIQELMRVLKPNGVVGTLDLIAKEGVNQQILDDFGNTMSALLGIKANILGIEQWKDIFHSTGAENPTVKETYNDVLVVTRSRVGTVKTILKMLYHMIINGPVRKKMMRLMKLQRTATLTSDDGFENLGYLVFTGTKSSAIIPTSKEPVKY